jgi:phosphohistidine phosphatase SixA
MAGEAPPQEAARAGQPHHPHPPDGERLHPELRDRPGPRPGNDISSILGACGWPDAGGSVLVVGHQPELGRLAALLLSGQEADWTIKKGALWWFTNRVRDDETQTVLRAVIPADLA